MLVKMQLIYYLHAACGSIKEVCMKLSVSRFRYVLALLICGFTIVEAQQYNVGGVTLNLPSPEGFVDMTASSSGIFDHFNASVPPQNRLISAYLTEGGAESVENGAGLNDDLNLLIQTSRATESLTLSKADFAEIQQASEHEFKSISLPDSIADIISENYTQRYNRKIDVEIGSMRSLGTFSQAEDHLSVLLIQRAAFTMGDSTSSELYATSCTIMNAAGKLLYVYVTSSYDSEDDLVKVKELSNTWREQILDANLAPPEESDGSDNDLFSSMLRGAIIGGIAGLVIAWWKRRGKRAAGNDEEQES